MDPNVLKWPCDSACTHQKPLRYPCFAAFVSMVFIIETVLYWLPSPPSVRTVSRAHTQRNLWARNAIKLQTGGKLSLSTPCTVCYCDYAHFPQEHHYMNQRQVWLFTRALLCVHYRLDPIQGRSCNFQSGGDKLFRRSTLPFVSPNWGFQVAYISFMIEGNTDVCG